MQQFMFIAPFSIFCVQWERQTFKKSASYKLVNLIAIPKKSIVATLYFIFVKQLISADKFKKITLTQIQSIFKITLDHCCITRFNI